MLTLCPGLAVQGLVNPTGSGARMHEFESWLRQNGLSKLQFIHLKNRDDFNLPYRVAVKIKEITPMKQKLLICATPTLGILGLKRPMSC